MKKQILCLVILLICFYIECAGADSLKQASSTLQNKRIYLGHRSVGYNLIQGIRILKEKEPLPSLSIVDADKQALLTGNGIFHSWMNEEGSPQDLASDFIAFFSKKFQKDMDIVYLRFTPYYVDKNLNKVMSDYKEAHILLKQQFPRTIFIHATFPLPHAEITWKTRVKQLINYDNIWEYGHSIHTNNYNRLLKQEYGEDRAFFDFAAALSTYPDGTRSYFTIDKNRYYHMVKEFTYDRTHLTKEGKIVVAEKFLLFLSDLMGSENR